ncbi:hypothetical protein [Curtobacterium luteum]|uniref:Uncharacterized protein n=1 Tax=Curtobacterium luteum TaxID=33881 RepID=A0A175RZI2_9MICO|nr:hypothetical protein [Curtobacterium luteum]KTR08364.1 hypothetical protein NS184_05945 [Curtobacterium luteum]
MFRLGWQVFRTRLPELVSDRDRRRLVVVAAIVAPVVFVGLLVVAALTDGITAGGTVAALLFGTAAGGFSMVFCRIGPKGWAIPPVPSIGWRTQEAVARYYRRNPPPVAPEHRDIVLRGIDVYRDLVVRATLQSSFLLGSWVLGLVGGILVAITETVTHGPVFLYAPVWPLIAGGYGIIGIRTLGRQEQLRVEASALPPVPPPPKRGRPGGPSGSKLALPGE